MPEKSHLSRVDHGADAVQPLVSTSHVGWALYPFSDRGYPLALSNVMSDDRTKHEAATTPQNSVILRPQPKNLGPRREIIFAYDQILRCGSGWRDEEPLLGSLSKGLRPSRCEPP